MSAKNVFANVNARLPVFHNLAGFACLQDSVRRGSPQIITARSSFRNSGWRHSPAYEIGDLRTRRHFRHRNAAGIQSLSCSATWKALLRRAGSRPGVLWADVPRPAMSAPALSVAKPQQMRPSFLSSVATVLTGQAACAALALVTEICYARFLGPAIRGQISLCMMTIGLGVVIGGLGGDVPIVIWMSERKRPAAEWLPASLLWGLGGSVFSVALWAWVFWRLHPAAVRDISPSLAVLDLLTIPVAIFSGYLMAILSGEERFRMRAGISVADQAAGLAAFLLVMLAFGRSPDSAVAGNLIGLIMGAALIAYVLRNALRGAWRAPRFDAGVRAGLWMGLRGQFGNTATFFNYRLDVFVLSAFLDPAQVGLYALGVAVSEALWQAPQAAAAALFPRTARTLDQGASEFTCRLLRQVLLLSVVMGLGIALAAPVAIPLVFGSRFGPSVRVIWWILPGTVALSAGKVACADLTARYKNGYAAAFSIVELGVTVALDLLLIPRTGIVGAAIASSASYLVFSVLIVAALRHELGVHWRDLFIPTFADFSTYRNVIARCTAWSLIVTNGSDSN